MMMVVMEGGKKVVGDRSVSATQSGSSSHDRLFDWLVVVSWQGDELVRITRESESKFTTNYLAAVRFAPLRAKPNLPVVLPRPVWSTHQHHTYPSHFR